MRENDKSNEAMKDRWEKHPAYKGVDVEDDIDGMDMSSFGKVINTIVSPTKAMKAIKKKPTILLAMVILPLLPLAFYLFFWDSYEIQLIQMMEAQFAAQGVEATREAMQMGLKFARVTTTVGAPFGVLFGVLIAALVYFLIGKIMKKEATFKQTFSMILHVSIISNFIWIVHMAVTVIQGESNLTAPITSIATLLPAKMYGSVIYGLLMPFEVISLWSAVVLFIGLRVVCGHSKKAAGIIVATGILLSMISSASTFMLTCLSGM